MAGGHIFTAERSHPMLTDLACKSAIKQAKHHNKRIKLFDGNGLFLDCRPNGSGYWRYKYRIAGKEKLLSFGTFPLISLGEAREKHIEARKVVINNKDPSSQRKAAAQIARQETWHTFEQVGRDWYLHNLKKWSSGHAAEIIRVLQKDLFRFIGHLPVKEITRLVLLQALQKIEIRQSHEIARKSLQYATNILRFAVVRDYAPYNVALDLKGSLKPYKRGHRPSMPIDHLSGFLRRLDQNEANLTGHERDALIMLMLTLVRSGELTKAKWPEFDLNKAVWIIPAERMKMRKEHIVPLSSQALAILTRRNTVNASLDRTQQSEYVFTSKLDAQKPMSVKDVGAAMITMGYRDIHTPHGFRALGMGIAKERLGYRHEVPDRQLAHVPTNAVDRAYDRSLFIEERTEMMQTLANYIDSARHQ